MKPQKTTSIAFAILAPLFFGYSPKGKFIQESSILPAESSGLSEMGDEKIANAKSFDELFRRTETVAISDCVMIATVDFIEVSSKGDFLITDRRGEQVLLLDAQGKLIKRLSPEKIHPGLHWRPYKAKFAANDYILVNRGEDPPLFLFDPSGICLKKIELSMWYPEDFYADRQLNIYGYKFSIDDDYCLSRLDSRTRKLEKFGSFPKQFKNYVSRMAGCGGLVVDEDGNLYQVHVS